jgi:hypothetical protein
MEALAPCVTFSKSLAALTQKRKSTQNRVVGVRLSGVSPVEPFSWRRATKVPASHGLLFAQDCTFMTLVT